MHTIFALLLAGSPILPDVDRRALELQARAEALQPAVAGTARPRPRRAAAGALDLSSITTICRAAGNQADPGRFLATLTSAYRMSGEEAGSLRASCAAYLAGQADARRLRAGR